MTMKPLISLYKFHQGNMVTEKCCSQGKGQITRQLDSSFFIIKNKVVIGHGKLSKLYVEGGSGHFHITINRSRDFLCTLGKQSSTPCHKRVHDEAAKILMWLRRCQIIITNVDNILWWDEADQQTLMLTTLKNNLPKVIKHKFRKVYSI